MEIQSEVVAVMEPVKKLVAALTARNDNALKEIIPNWESCKKDVYRVIDEHYQKLSAPPPEAYSAIEYEVGDETKVTLPIGWKSPMTYIVKSDFDLWDIDCFLWADDGLSDLVVRFLVQGSGPHKRILELRDILVP